VAVNLYGTLENKTFPLSLSFFCEARI
jgi:hypothetical protein